MGWQFDNDQPIYLQIVNEIKQRIIAGEYPPGSQLPTVRQLAEIISVNPNTVQKAMGELEQEGLVFSQGTVGRFIANDEDLPEKLLKSLVTSRIKEFLASMQALGLDRNKIVTLIEEIGKEEPA